MLALEKFGYRPGALMGVFDIGLGLILLGTYGQRASAASFTTPKAVMPLAIWGLLFLLGGLACLNAARLKNPYGVLALLGGAATATFWSTALLLGGVLDDRVPYTGAWVYGFVALLHLVAALRIARRAG